MKKRTKGSINQGGTTVKRSRKVLSAILAAACAVLICVSFGLLSGTGKTAVAKAPSGGAITIGEIAPGSGGNTFSGEKLAELYDAILGADYDNIGTYNKVKADLAANGTAKVGSGVSTKALNATDIRTRNNGVDVYVTFGGIVWELVYVTTNSSGDVIVDLYQASSTETSRFSGGTGYTKNNAYTLANVGSVYGSSYIRAVTLGNGGTYYTYSSQSQATAGTAATATAGSGTWGRFAAGDLSSYLDAPSAVDYQEKQGWVELMGLGKNYNQAWNFQCDAYGTPTVENWFYGNVNYPNNSTWNGVSGNWTDHSSTTVNSSVATVTVPNYPKAGYYSWSGDKIWLPSLTETGNGTDSNGIWGLNNDQRSNIGGTATTQPAWNATQNQYSWLRSGSDVGAAGACSLTSAGGNGGAYTSSALAVRPALHLNLKSAALSAAGAGTGADYETVNKPENLTITYNGTEYTDLKTLVTYVKTQVAASNTEVSGVTKWYDDEQHKLTTSAAASSSNTGHIVTSGAAVEYKIEFTPQGKTSADTVTQTAFSVKNAGTYKITCAFENTHDYKWRSSSSGAIDTSATCTFTITVKQKEVKYKWKNTGLDTAWEATFNPDTFTPTTGTSAAPWVYLDYTLLNTGDNNTLPTYDATQDKVTANELVPCVVLKFVNSDGYDNDIEKIFAKRDGTRGTDHPKEAGSYTVHYVDKNASTSNYKLVGDTGEGATRAYIINQLEVDAPGTLTNPEYNGQEQSFNVAKYNKKYMDYGTLSGSTFTQGAMPKDDNGVDLGMTADTTSGLKLKATKVNKYKIAYQLKTSTVQNSTDPIVRNYKWKGNATGTAAHEVTYEITPKKLAFDFTSTASGGSFTVKTSDKTSKLTFSYSTGKGPVGVYTFDGTSWVQDTDTDGPVFEKPVLELWFYYNADTNAADNPNAAASDKELLYKELKALDGKQKTGKYTVVIKLADSTANPVNKNYVLVDDDTSYPHEKEVELKAGEASLDDIKQVYKDSTMGGADNPLDLPFDDGANVKNLTYKWDANNKKAVEYFFTLDFTDVDFLEVAGPYTYKYSDGSTLGAGQGFAKADTVKVIVTVQVKSSEQGTNKMPTEAEYAASAGANGNKFKYTYIDDTKGTLEFEYKIEKADVDATELAKNTLLQYRMGASDSWHDYDPDNPPEYTGSNIEVQVNTSKLPEGIDTWKIETSDYLGNRKGPGSITLTVHYTVKDNYNAITGNSQVYALTISPQVIDSGNWTTGFYTDSDGNPINDDQGVPYQIYELSLEDPAFADFIKYEYYLADMTDPLNPVVGGFIGVGDTALKDLTDPLGAYKASSTNPVSVYVKAVVDPAKMPQVNNNDKYVLKDSTGKDGYKLFSLGESKDLIKVTVKQDKSEYKDALTLADILEFKLEDGSTCPTAHYTLNVYKDKIDPANLIGDISGFDFSNADAGKYVIEISLTDPDSYACTKPFVNFIIEPKTIAVPTLKDITFTGNELNLADYLTGDSWTTYGPNGMNIITLGGVDAARDVHQGGYVATLTLTNPNYKWDYSTGTTPAPTAYVSGNRVLSAVDKAAADGDVSVSGTDTQANYNWNVAPLVVDATNLWNKGKDGATLNLPQNIKDLISAGTLEVGYQYFDADGNFIETPEIKGGKSFNVSAVFAGQDSDLGNVVFKTKDASGNEQLGATTAQVPYTVPQSGAAAFFGNALSFFKSNWLWFLIGLIALILLIILIVVIAKRRKNKEEREAKKQAKEEEKQRKEEEKRRREEEREEEKRRREEEREAEKERQKAELELAKAKQEAELAKMKAEAAAAAGMGMAGVAVAAQQPQVQQQPQAQPVQQVVDNTNNELLREMREQMAELRAENRALQQQKQQPVMQQPQVQQVTDPNALARIEAELAAMRAENRANHNNGNAMPMAQPMMMPQMMQMPMQMPNYGPMPSYGGGQVGDVNQELRARLAEERARTAEDRLFRTTEQRAILAEDRLARGGAMPAQQPMYMQAQPVMQQPQQMQPPVQTVYLPAQQTQQPAVNNNGTNADTFGAVLASMFKSLTDNNNVKTEKKQAQEVAQVIEAESQPTAVNAPTVYPPDAVVTTTTTIDTTKNKAQPRAVRSDDGRLFDIDGFYDTFDGNK